MKFSWKRSAVIGAAMLSLGALGATPALAEYPDKPVSFIIPWGPGGLEDTITRLIARDFQEEYGVPAAVVNKPSGGGGPFAGAAYAAQQPADGATIGSFVIDVPVVGPHIGIPELAPDPFDLIGIFLTFPFVIVTSKDAPYQTMEELAAYAQDHDISLGHYGAPLIPTKVTLALAKKMGFSYAKDAAFDSLKCSALASGDVDVMNTVIHEVLACLDDVTVLASITNDPVPSSPGSPTVGSIEPSLEIALWNGLFVHKDTPADVRAKIIAVASKTVMGKEAQQLGANAGAFVYWKGPEAARAQLATDIETSNSINAFLK